MEEIKSDIEKFIALRKIDAENEKMPIKKVKDVIVRRESLKLLQKKEWFDWFSKNVNFEFKLIVKWLDFFRKLFKLNSIIMKFIKSKI